MSLDSLGEQQNSNDAPVEDVTTNSPEFFPMPGVGTESPYLPITKEIARLTAGMTNVLERQIAKRCRLIV